MTALARQLDPIEIPDAAPSAAAELDEILRPLSLGERLEVVAERFAAPILTNGFGPEGQAITHALASAGLDIRIVTLQTGRLFPETEKLIDDTRKRLGVVIEEIHPDANAVDKYVRDHGLDGFYDSKEAREACCAVRKVNPLNRVLKGADAWIAGLRRTQSAHRGGVRLASWDYGRGLMKINPLADWSKEKLDVYLEANDVPVNPLIKRGFASIGCEPCTRAIKPGEDERAGRWWWENDERRECGLHLQIAK